LADASRIAQNELAALNRCARFPTADASACSDGHRSRLWPRRPWPSVSATRVIRLSLLPTT